MFKIIDLSLTLPIIDKVFVSLIIFTLFYLKDWQQKASQLRNDTNKIHRGLETCCRQKRTSNHSIYGYE